MIVGKDIVSAFAGAADSNSFPNLYAESSTKTIKKITSKSTVSLEKYYGSGYESTETRIHQVILSCLEDLFEEVTSSDILQNGCFFLKLWNLLMTNKSSLIQSIHDYFGEPHRCYILN